MLSEQYEEEQDEIGPATDLTLSLLAVVLVLLALVIFENTALENQNLQAKKDIGRLNEERENWWEIYSDLYLRINELEEEKKRLQGQLEGEKPESMIFAIENKNFDLFEIGKANLNIVKFHQELKKLEPEIKRIIKDSEFNIIRVDGHASPESRPGSGVYRNIDTNMALSSERAIGLAQYLHTRGIPYNCTVATGYGRTRSKKFMDLLKDKGISLIEWDRKYLARKLSDIDPRIGRTQQEYKDYFERFYAEDRRVDLIFAHEKNSNCRVGDMHSALKKLLRDIK